MITEINGNIVLDDGSVTGFTILSNYQAEPAVTTMRTGQTDPQVWQAVDRIVTVLADRLSLPTVKADLETMWRPGCERCARYKADPEPGYFTWVEMVHRHFERDHRIALVSE